MIMRAFSFAPVVFSMIGLSGCGVSKIESTEECIERFVDAGPDIIATGKGEFVPTFTYDISQVEDAFASIYGGPVAIEGFNVTAASGPSGPALEAFYKDEVPPNGAWFAGEDISLFRTKGLPGSRDETIAAGCRSAPERARLIHISWTPDYAEARN